MLLAAACVAAAGTARAQLLPSGTGYFQNRYVLNPAFAGFTRQLTVNAAYRREQANIDQGPTSQYVTADYGLTNSVGVGVNAYNEKAGVLKNTNVMATYAYHISFSESRKLHLGLSAGVRNERIDYGAVNGEQDDATLTSFNSRGVQFDADFGAAYTDGGLTIQAAAPGLVTNFKSSTSSWVNKPVFFAAASYKVKISEDGEGIWLQPMAMFRQVKGYDNLVDAGAQCSFLEERMYVFGMYQSSKSFMAGAGAGIIKDVITINAVYNTRVNALKGYSGGNFEIGFTLKPGHLAKH
ncbi:hypothetical protein FLA_6049 [Filimonas lacunae]|nr:hypothetical protein FLA_6049 [Filimonas lacunae]